MYIIYYIYNIVYVIQKVVRFWHDRSLMLAVTVG